MVTAVSNNIRYACMQATMEMVSGLEVLSSGERLDATVSGLMAVSHGVPVRVMCIELYPHEQDILPLIATSLAYMPALMRMLTYNPPPLCIYKYVSVNMYRLMNVCLNIGCWRAKSSSCSGTAVELRKQ